MRYLFLFHKDNFLHEQLKIILKELKKQEMNISKNREVLIQNMIEKEIADRNIPDDYHIGIEELIEIYKNDFNSCIAMEHQYISLDESNLFYYLSTVNKIYSNYPDYVKTGRITIRFMIMKLQYNSICDENLQNYIEITERCFSENRKIKKLEVIKFPKKS